MSYHYCSEECGWCMDKAAAREMERDYPEPLSRGEEERLDNWAEREMDRRCGEAS